MPNHFVGVRCALSVLEEREKKRADRRVGLSRWQFDRVHERKVYDLEVNTENQTADACAAMILKTIEEKVANPPLPTPVSVTPAASAPVAPLPDAAGLSSHP